MLPPKMLKALEIYSEEELFDEIPEKAKVRGLELPCGLSERDLRREVEGILRKNRSADDLLSFLGGGVYRHHSPAAVGEIVGRSEFYSSYTPYQAEASQGMLQALFEYQSFISELTGMDAVNSSMYDWSTALGEAALMCNRIRHGTKFLIARSISPERKSVLRTYLKGIDAQAVEVGFDPVTGRLDTGDLRGKLDDSVFGFYLENPNYFGVLEEGVEEVSSIIGDLPFVLGTDPLSLSVMRPPVEYGADIVIGEGHHLGAPPSFGGPLLGMFGTTKEHIRKMPGRIIGATVDAEGRRAFCMTLQTREQHIRRDKATSNICTNEALMAVAASAFLSSVGRRGLVDMASENIIKTRQLADMITEMEGFESPAFKASHFNEFVFRCPRKASDLMGHLLGKGILGGVLLCKSFPDLGESILVAVSEEHSAADMQRYVAALEEMK